MNNKISFALITGTTLLATVLAPAFAADNTPVNGSSEKTIVKVAQAPRSGRVERRGECGGKEGFGRPGAMRFHRHHHSALSALRGDLALSDAQCEKIYSLKNDFRDSVGPKFAELMSSKREMKDLLTQTNLDKGKIEALEQKIDNERSTISDLKLKMKLNEIAVLTDAQRQAIREHVVKAAVYGHGFGRGFDRA